MRRFLVSLFIAMVMVAAIPLGAAAQEGSDEAAFEGFLDALFIPDFADSNAVVAITVNGEQIVLEPGHDPVTDGVFLIDFSQARGAFDDSGDGEDSAVDILRGWGNVVHVSDAAVEYLSPHFLGFRLGSGLFGPLDGSTPSFPSESMVVGFETAEDITDEDDPTEIKVNIRYQGEFAYTYSDLPVSETDDVNGGHNGSIGAFQMDGAFGTIGYLFPGGVFNEIPTEFFGRALGNQMSFGGPWQVLDGAGSFALNTSIWPAFDSVELGDLEHFGFIGVYRFGEMDINLDGVFDPMEVAEPTEEPAEEPVEEPQTEEPATISEEEETAEATEDPGEAQSESGSTESDGVSIWLILAGVFLVSGLAGVFLYLRNREQEKCVPEAEALATAKARVTEKEAAVEKARAAVEKAEEHLTYTEENASEQREQRLVEAQQVVSAKQSELNLAEGELSDARAEQTAAQYAYDVCMGFITPEPEPEPPAPPPVVPAPVPDTPDPTPTPTGETDTGQPGVIDDGGGEPGTAGGSAPPPPPPPPPKKAECADGQTREVEERSGSFTIPVDSVVRLSMGTDDGPLDDLEDMATGTPIGDLITGQIAEFLTPDSLGVSASSLSAGSARSWQSGLEKMATAARTEIEILIEYDVEDVSLVCIRLEQCQKDHWVTVGHRVDELSRSQRTVSARWETVSSSRPLGATFTSVRRGLDNASESEGEMNTFSSNCK